LEYEVDLGRGLTLSAIILALAKVAGLHGMYEAKEGGDDDAVGAAVVGADVGEFAPGGGACRVAGLNFGTTPAPGEGVGAAVGDGGVDGGVAVPGRGTSRSRSALDGGEGGGAVVMKAAPGAAFLPLVAVFTTGVETLSSFFLAADPEAVVGPAAALASSSGEGGWSALGWDFFQSLASSTFEVLRPVFVTREPSLDSFLFLSPFLPILASGKVMGVGEGKEGEMLEESESCGERDGRSKSRSGWTLKMFDLFSRWGVERKWR
jgi:hypothetical protein